MDKIKSLDTGTYTEGLILAQDLLNKRITSVGFARKYSKLKRAELFESKTGLFTPAFFRAELNQELAAAGRSGRPLSLMVVDLDKLKRTNDTYGHLMGDKVIMAVGMAIKSSIRQEDVPCRWGGDEFTIILPDTNITGGVILASRIQQTVSKIDFRKGNTKIPIHLSIGLSQLTKGDSPDSLFERADQAVYRSKTKGGGLVEIA